MTNDLSYGVGGSSAVCDVYLLSPQTDGLGIKSPLNRMPDTASEMRPCTLDPLSDAQALEYDALGPEIWNPLASSYLDAFQTWRPSRVQ